MKRFVIFGSVLVALICFGSTFVQAPERWEYAMLVQLEGGICAWNDSDEGTNADSAHELYRALGGTSERGDFTLEDLFTIFGRDGWQMVTIDRQSGATTYHFKRVQQ